MNLRLHILSLGLVSSALAAPVTLIVQPGGSGQTSFVSDSGFALLDVDFGGTIEADVVIDPISGKPQTFLYLGDGGLTFSDGSTSFTSFTIPETDSFEFIYTGISSDLITKPGGGAVDQETCLLEASEHEAELNTGQVLVKYYYGGFFVGEVTEDYSQNPTKSDTRGASKVTAELLQSGLVLDRYLVTLEHDSAHNEVQDEFPFLTINESGGFTATGEVEVPSASLSQWVVASGGEVPGSGDDLLGGVPVAILYALGLAAGENEISWMIDPVEREVTLQLPVTGTRADLMIETCHGLDHWAATPLAAGTSGDYVIALPVGHTFVRLAMPPS